MRSNARRKAGGFMLSEHDYKLLCTFTSPREVDPSELDEVERLVSRHLLAQGIDLDPERQMVLTTARLSDNGKRMLRLETEARGEGGWIGRTVARLYNRLSLT